MGLKPFIRKGDRTSHGGSVISGDPTFIVDGQPVARLGDLTVCPRCKGIFAITQAVSHGQSQGATLALHGDKTACGARLIASQSTTLSIQSDEVSLHAAPEPEVVGPALAPVKLAAGGPKLCLTCLVAAGQAGATLVPRGT